MTFWYLAKEYSIDPAYLLWFKTKDEAKAFNAKMLRIYPHIEGGRATKIDAVFMRDRQYGPIVLDESGRVFTTGRRRILFLEDAGVKFWIMNYYHPS